MRGGAFLRKPRPVTEPEAALRRASTQAELEDAWFQHADELPDDSPERKRLLGIYMERVAEFKAALRAADYLRAG